MHDFLQKEQFDLMQGKRILFNTSIGPGFDVESLKDWLKEDNHYFFGDTLATAGDNSIWELKNTFTINRSNIPSLYQTWRKSYQQYKRISNKKTSYYLACF